MTRLTAGRSGRPALTSARRGLDRIEWLTTGFAVATSSALFLLLGHPYLARGVVGFRRRDTTRAPVVTTDPSQPHPEPTR